MKLIQLMHEWLYFIVLDEWKALTFSKGLGTRLALTVQSNICHVLEQLLFVTISNSKLCSKTAAPSHVRLAHLSLGKLFIIIINILQKYNNSSISAL